MKNINITQMIVTGVAVIAIFAGVVVFALYRGVGDNSNKNGQVILWGAFSQEQMGEIFDQLTENNIEIDRLEYVEKDANTFDQELLQAIADGTGPDLVLLNEKQIIKNEKRLQHIPFKSFPAREYQDMFLEEGLLLLKKDSVIGLPFLIDPLVLYYNKDMLINAGFSKPPQTWSEVLAVSPVITKKDSSFNISQSTIALGAFDNIRHAKDIYWALLLQAGTPVIVSEVTNEGDEFYKSVFNENFNFTLNPAYAATNFYTQFSNPTKTVYSWNRSLSDSQTMFVSGDLAFYIGYTSELEEIKRLNPNLNFDITLLPQSQNSTRKITYGAMYTLAIPNGSQNPYGAYAVMNQLLESDVQEIFAQNFLMSSVRSDAVNSPTESEDKYRAIINRSAIMAQGVLEPDQQQTTDIIRDLIYHIESGQFEISEAIAYANQKLVLLLGQK